MYSGRSQCENCLISKTSLAAENPNGGKDESHPVSGEPADDLCTVWLESTDEFQEEGKIAPLWM